MVRSGDHLHEESLLRRVTAVLVICVFSGSVRHNTVWRPIAALGMTRVVVRAMTTIGLATGSGRFNGQ